MNLDWRKGLLYAAVAGIQGCWLYALIMLLNIRAADGRLSVLGLLLLYPVSAGLSSLLRRLRWPQALLRGISFLAWAAGMLITVKIQLFSNLAWADTTWLLAIPQAISGMLYAFKPALLVLIGTAVIWWLGRRLAYTGTGFARLVTEFQFGLVMLVITFFVASQLEISISHSIYLVATFFLFSLAGISIAHAREGTGWLSGLYQGHWAGLLLVSIGLVLILGFIVSLVITPDLLNLIITAVKWVWGLVIKVMLFIASLLPEPEGIQPAPEMPVPGGQDPEEALRLLRIPETLRRGLSLVWMIAFGGAMLFALWRISSEIFGWLRRRLAGSTGGEFETLPGAFKADFLGLLKRFLFRLLGLKNRLRPRARAVLPEIAPVRQIYRQFLRWAVAAGFPRQKSQTPGEFFYQLAGAFPDARGDLELITQQYVRSRYGSFPVTEDELYRLKQSWYNIKQKRPGGRRH